MTAQSILNAGIKAISDRSGYRDENGEKSFELAAQLFTNLTGHRIDEAEACLFLACVKLARAVRGSFHVDDYIDASAYIALAGEARAGQVRPARKGPVGSDMQETGDDGRSRTKPNVAGLRPDKLDLCGLSPEEK